jgi:DNA-binding PadR family transcriptional regulator
VSKLKNPSEAVEALPLSETTFLILVSLNGGPKHGYAIMKEVEELSQGRVRLSTGTLYGAIKRMLADTWIRRVEETAQTQDRRERKSYALSERGGRILEAELQRLRKLLEISERRYAGGA